MRVKQKDCDRCGPGCHGHVAENAENMPCCPEHLRNKKRPPENSACEDSCGAPKCGCTNPKCPYRSENQCHGECHDPCQPFCCMSKSDLCLRPKDEYGCSCSDARCSGITATGAVVCSLAVAALFSL